MKRKIMGWICAAIMSGTLQAQPPKPPGNEEKVKHVSEKISKEISLTAVQKQKVESAYKDFFVEMDKLRQKNGKPDMPPPPPPPPGKKEDVEKLSKARDVKIRSILNDAQYAKYASIEKTLHPPPQGPPGDRKPD